MKSAGKPEANRRCPCCSGEERSIIIAPDAAAIVRSNWSYRPDGLLRLGLSGREVFPIVLCRACGFAYASWLPDPDFLRLLYDDVIDTEAARLANLSASNAASKMQYVSTLLQLVDGKSGRIRILDYGCGFGPTLRLLAAVPGIEATGYETSKARLDELQAAGLRALPDVNEAASRGPFDAVILDNVLEHVEDPAEVLQWARTTTTPGALLYVSVPDLPAEKIARKNNAPTLQMDINPWEHLNYFDIHHLDLLARRAGFAPITAAHLPSEIRVGLRPETLLVPRIRNVLGSMRRMAGYAITGNVSGNVTNRFYRLAQDGIRG